jgi:hypothetical protein
MYLLIKYIKSALWRVVKRLSYIEEAWCLKVNIQCNPSNRYVEELRKTKKQLPIILELLAKMSSQLLDPNPIVVCTEHLVTFESVVITRKLLTDYPVREEGAPIPMGMRSKARVCVRRNAGIAGLNPVGGMDICLLCFV